MSGIMKNVTVTLDERTLGWARMHAARRNMSSSRFLGELLKEKMRESRKYSNAMRQFWGVEAQNLTGSKPYPKREEVHDRKGLR